MVCRERVLVGTYIHVCQSYLGCIYCIYQVIKYQSCPCFSYLSYATGSACKSTHQQPDELLRLRIYTSTYLGDFILIYCNYGSSLTLVSSV